MKAILITTALLIGLSMQAQRLTDPEIAEIIMCKSPYDLSFALKQHDIQVSLTANDGERAMITNGNRMMSYAFNTKRGKITEVFIRYRRDNPFHMESFNSYSAYGNNPSYKYDKDMGQTMGHLKVTSIIKCK